MAEIQIADVRAQVMFSLFTDFKNFSEFAPDPRHDAELDAMLKQLVAMGHRAEDRARRCREAFGIAASCWQLLSGAV